MAGERIFEFGGEDRQTVKEKGKVEAFLALFTVLKLSDNGEDVGIVEPLKLLVKAAGWSEIGEFRYGLLAATVVLFLNHMDELPNEIKHAVACPNSLPQVGRSETL